MGRTYGQAITIYIRVKYGGFYRHAPRACVAFEIFATAISGRAIPGQWMGITVFCGAGQTCLVQPRPKLSR